MNENLNQITKMVLDIFYQSTQRDRIKVKVEYVDDLYNRRLELVYNDKEKDDLINNKAFIEGLNGTIVMSKTKDRSHNILISKNVLNETFQFISTIIHELTHIHDFVDFVSEFCDGNYESIGEHDLFGMFYYWTEFNARRNGYLYYRKILFQIQDTNYNHEEQVNHILNTELKLQYDYLLGNLRKYRYDKDAVNYIYSVIQFMGRFSVWEDLFPDRINPHNYLPDYLQTTYGSEIIELYDILHSMVNFNIAKVRLEQLGSLISSLFSNYRSKEI